MSNARSHRLDGLEPDNLLGFLALLGLLRALDAVDRQHVTDEKLFPRAAWDLDHLPLRPRLFLAHDTTREEVTATAADGLGILASSYDFAGRQKLDYGQEECRSVLLQNAKAAHVGTRDRVDLLASLMTDAAIKDDKNNVVDPTPFCLLFGQGHQYFLDRLASVPHEGTPPPRGRGKKAVVISAAQCLWEALFEPWHRNDPTFSFRWDPEEDVRYALMAGDPTDAAFKNGTQHGANRLAAIGLATLTVVPETRGGRVRPHVIGGASGRDGFSFAWPIWREPATLTAIRALLAQPDLRKPGGLANLGVAEVVVARRISVGKFMNFARARPLGAI